jgi:hypothetical protein
MVCGGVVAVPRGGWHPVEQDATLGLGLCKRKRATPGGFKISLSGHATLLWVWRKGRNSVPLMGHPWGVSREKMFRGRVSFIRESPFSAAFRIHSGEGALQGALKQE